MKNQPTMKTIRFYDIDFLFETCPKYQEEYCNDYTDDEDDYQSIYDREMEYLESIREVVLVIDDSDWDQDVVPYFDYLQDYLMESTGEYIEDFKFEVIPNTEGYHYDEESDMYLLKK